MSKTVLYFMDSTGISEGYRPLFNKILEGCGIPISSVQLANVYSVVPDAVKARGNEIEKSLNPEKKEQVSKYVNHIVQVMKPQLIVTSCPAALGVLNGFAPGATKISQTRGSLYDFNGIPVLVATPINAIHRNQKTKEIRLADNNQDVIAVSSDSYKIKDGHWFLVQDWKKIARFYKNATRKMPEFRYSVVRYAHELVQVEESLKEAVLISIDIETHGSHEAGGYIINCVGYGALFPNGQIHNYVIPFANPFKFGGCFWNSDLDFMSALQCVRRINANKAIKVMQNGSYDSAYFITYGMPVENYLLDTMHMWHSLFPELDKSLDIIASILCDNYAYWKSDRKGQEEENVGRKEKGPERFWRYNALDCYYTLCSALQLLAVITGFKETKTNYANEFVQMLGGLTLTMRGIRADFARREELRAKLQGEYDEANARFKRMIDDPDFNVNSSKQKCELFYDILGATPRGKTGKPLKGAGVKGRSAGKYPLKMIRSEHPFLKKIVDAMDATAEPLKQISNVCDMTVATSRVRSSISVRTETWRFSSSSSPFWDGSNLQNIRKSMRDWMVADEGHLLFDVDYSQSDAVFVAYESNDENYIKTMTSGKDTHAIHGEFFFKTPYDDIIKGKKADDPLITHPILGIRNITKRIVHGANFQMGGATLYLSQMGKEATVATANYLGFPTAATWTEEQYYNFCQTLLNRFRGLYPRLSAKGWYGEIEKQLIATRKCTNAFDMTRTFVGSPTDPATQREATAFYGQSDTAGNMNRALEEILYGYIPPRFRDGPNEHAKEKPLQLDNKEYGLKMLLQVHDSFIGQIDMKAPRAKEALHNVLTVMQRPITINGHRVTVPTEIEIGTRWGKDMKPWKPGDSL